MAIWEHLKGKNVIFIIILLLSGTLLGFLFSGMNIYSYNPVIHEFIWVKNWIFTEYMNNDYKYFFPLIKYGIFIRFGYLFIYSSIIYLLVWTIFKNKIFSQITLYTVMAILLCNLIPVIFRRFLPGIYFNFYIIFNKLFLLSYVLLNPPLLEVISLTLFAFIESENKKKRNKIQ